MATITLGEVRIGTVRSLLRSAGPSASKEAMVFIHGNPGSSADWTSLLAHAGDLGRAIAPDLPGYGKADRPPEFDYTTAGYAAYLGTMLDQLGIERAHLVLHDLGGFWGLKWAADHPNQVASVALFNTGLMPNYRWHKFARIWRTPIVGELFQLLATRAGFRALLAADNPRPFPAGFLDAMYDDYDRGMKRAVLKYYRASSNPGAQAEKLAAVLAPRRLPALVLWGDDDKYSPVGYAQKQQDFFDAEVHVLPGCGHWTMIDEPEKSLSLVLPFLRRQLAER
jgi:pimeloyl-ACP methyl ester carboxylesterase